MEQTSVIIVKNYCNCSECFVIHVPKMMMKFQPVKMNNWK